LILTKPKITEKEVIFIQVFGDLNVEVGKFAYNFPGNNLNELVSANMYCFQLVAF